MASRSEKKVYPVLGSEHVIEIELDASQVETPYQSLPQEQHNGLDREELKVGGKWQFLQHPKLTLFLAVKKLLLTAAWVCPKCGTCQLLAY